MKLKTFADFRRFLAMPGATVTPIRHDHAAKWPEERRPLAFEPRTVAKLQTNAVKWQSGGWTMWPKGARHFTLDGSEQVTFRPDVGDDRLLVFKCEVRS